MIDRLDRQIDSQTGSGNFADGIVDRLRDITFVALGMTVATVVGLGPKAQNGQPVPPRLDLGQAFNQDAVSKQPLPVVDMANICNQLGTTRDAVADVHGLDSAAADRLFAAINATTGQKFLSSSDHFPKIYDGINPFQNGAKVTTEIGLIDHQPHVGYVDVDGGGVRRRGQLFVYDEARSPGEDMPRCSDHKWVIAVEFTNPADQKLPFAQRLQRFMELVDGATGFQERLR